MSTENQTDRDDCYICGAEGQLERHHIVPRRYGGSDQPYNLVDLCPTCHVALETLYGKRFYHRLGVEACDGIPSYAAHDIVKRLERAESEIHELRADFEYGALFGTSIKPAEDEDIDVEERDEEQEPTHSTDHTDTNEDRESAAQWRMRNIKEIIAEVADEYYGGAPPEEVLDRAEAVGMERAQAEHELEKLSRQGDVYKPSSGGIRVV